MLTVFVPVKSNPGFSMRIRVKLEVRIRKQLFKALSDDVQVGHNVQRWS